MMWQKLKISGAKLLTSAVWFSWFAMIFLLLGCATSQPKQSIARPSFDFAKDTFSFSNQLSWDYFFDANGKWTNRKHEPPPEYSQHCFVLAHAAKQFFKHAEFHLDQPIADEKTYRKVVHKIVFGGDMRPETLKIEIPGYANLKEFSRAQEKSIKAESGRAWRSYFQRGHWRSLGPFTRHGQEITSEKFVCKLEQNQPFVAHLVRFPQLSINHALLVVGFKRTAKGIDFSVYDPNTPLTPSVMTYDGASRTFFLPSNAYFYGGKVNVYEVYRSCFY